MDLQTAYIPRANDTRLGRETETGRARPNLRRTRWLPHAMVARLGEREVYWFIRLGRTADRY